MPDLEPADSDASHWLFDPGPSFLYSGTQFPLLLNKETRPTSGVVEKIGEMEKHQAWPLAPGPEYMCGKVQLSMKLPKDRCYLCYPLRRAWGPGEGQLLHLRAFGEEVAVLETNGP